MILVTGATGSNGTELVKLLSKRGATVRAMVRDPSKASHFANIPNVEPVVADFDKPDTIETALRGAQSAFLVTNSTEKAEAQQLAFVRVAAKVGLAHVVKLSQFAADKNSPVRFLRYHAKVEEEIIHSGTPYTFLRPNLYMQGLLNFADTIREKGSFFVSAGDSEVSVVDVRDIAAVASTVLTEPGHAGKTYTVTGPEALSHADMANALSHSTGKKIEFVDVPPDAMRDALTGLGMPVWQADGLVEDYAHYRRGEAATLSGDVEQITGRPARTFARFAEDFAEQFRSRDQ